MTSRSMATLQLITSLLLLTRFTGVAFGKYFYAHNTPRQGHCQFTGYLPGGNIVTVPKIIAPEVKIQQASLLFLSGEKHNIGMAEDAIEYLETIGTILSPVAPYLEIGLAVFSLASSGKNKINGKDKPTLQDIITETNNAVHKLTADVNHRLDRMQGYVDQKIINNEKEAINVEFQQLFTRWENCADHRDKATVDGCQMRAIEAIRAAYPQFCLFYHLRNSFSENNPPTIDQVKRMEANMFNFRDYMQLDLMALQIMVNTYKGDTLTKSKYHTYLEQLKEDAQRAIEYSNLAYKWALDLHGRRSKKYCKETLTCEPLKQTSTTVSSTCKCQFEATLRESDSCSMHVSIRKYGNPDPYTRTDIYADTNNEAVKARASWLLTENTRNSLHTSKSYLYNMKNTIEKFWKREVLDLQTTWRIVADKAQREVTKLGRKDEWMLNNDLFYDDNLDGNRFADYKYTTEDAKLPLYSRLDLTETRREKMADFDEDKDDDENEYFE